MTERVEELFRSRRAQAGLFAAVTVTMIGIRFVVFASDGAPPTIDAGNWLAFGDSLLGEGARSSSISYPPVVPLLTHAFVAVIGLTNGVSLLAAIAATAPGVGVFVALGSAGLGRARLFPAIVLLGVGSVGEAASWGGFPQLLGMGLLPYGVLATHRFLDDPSRRTAFRFGLVVMAMLAISHFVAAVLVVASLVGFGTELYQRRSGAWVFSLVRLSPLVVLPSVWLVPIYLDLIDAVFWNPNEFAELDNLTFSNFFDRLEGIYSDAPFLWRLLIPLTVITPFLRWPKDRWVVVKVQRSLFLALAVMLFVAAESRYLYLLPTLAMLSVALWIREAARRLDVGSSRPSVRKQIEQRRLLLGVVVVLAVLAQTFAGLRLLDDQRYFFTAMSPPLVEAIELAGEEAGEGGTIAVPSVRNAPIGWWVEALTKRRVVYGSALRWLNFADEVERAAAANTIFTPDFPTEDTVELFSASRVDVVVLPRTWEWFDDDDIADWIAENELDLVLTNGDALVVRLE